MKNQLLLFACLLAFTAASQTARKSAVECLNGIQFGAIGEANMISLQFNRTFPMKDKTFWDAKLGLGLPWRGLQTGDNKDNTGIGVPHSFSFNYGFRHCLEVGIVGNFSNVRGDNSYNALPLLGYKFRAIRSRILFRLFIHPFASDNAPDETTLMPFGGSIGFGF